MPDIERELDIIANEPKGAMVKQAIWDALNKINATADIRPYAKIDVPVGDPYIDTGFINEGIIGDFVVGEASTMIGQIRTARYVDPNYKAEITGLHTMSSGRAVLVCLGYWNDSSATIPTVSNSTGTALSWTRIGSYKVEFKIQNGEGNANIHSQYPAKDTSVKGLIEDQSGLPSSGMSDGDIYICTSDDTAYMYDGDTSEWIHPSGTSLTLLSNLIERRLTVWTAEVESDSDMNVSVVDNNLGTEMSLGLFFVNDTGTFNPSEMDVRLCLVDNNSFKGEKTITKAAYTYKGVVATMEDLPADPEIGDRYYVTDTDRLYAYETIDDDTDWYWDGTVYDASTDSVAEKHDTGFESNTKKIFVTLTADQVGGHQPILVPSEQTVQQTDLIVCSTTDACAMNAFLPKARTVVPSALPYRNTYNYYWLYNGSIAVLPIEFVAREEET